MKKIFTVQYQAVVNAANITQQNFKLKNNNNPFSIKRITIQAEIVEGITNKVIKLINSDIALLTTLIGDAIQPFCYSFDEFIPDNPASRSDGKIIFLTNDGQYSFDSLFINNEIPILVTFRNRGSNILTANLFFSFEIETAK